MISIKTAKEIEVMRAACRISAEALARGGEAVRPGISTAEIDRIIYRYIKSQGARPNFLGYGGFPASACISVNDQVIHGIPSPTKILHPGDIVKIDVGAEYGGFNGDNAATFAVGEISATAQKLIDVTKTSLEKAIEAAVCDNYIRDISTAVEEYALENGFVPVHEYVGHGIGRNLHEQPDVPNYRSGGRGAKLIPGMTLAVEPMINEHSHEVKKLSDGWTVLTQSGGLSAHFEHTILITRNGPEILTRF